MTNQELINELRKPGKVYAQIRTADNGFDFVSIEKKDFIQILQGRLPRAKADWELGGNYLEGRKLVVV